MRRCCSRFSKRFLMPFNEPTSLNPVTHMMSESPNYQFCALEYRPQDQRNVSQPAASVILHVLKDDKGNLRFFVRRDWCTLVEEEDIDYIESLLRDFLECAKLRPEKIFKQLFSVGVGPLVTQEVGSENSDLMLGSELSSQ